MQTQLSGTYSKAEQASPDARAAFIRRTYQHLAMAILAFMGLEFVIFKTGIAAAMTRTMLGGKFSWLVVLGAFMIVSWVAEKWAHSSVSKGAQYLGLGLYVVAEAIIFVPLLYIAVTFSSPDTIPIAAVITGLLFLGLTVTAFTTRKDFSFLGGILKVGGCVALGVIVCSIMFGFSLGIVFAGVMVAFASGAILYSTSRIIHDYNTDQHVAASLSLFASVALLFWYVLRILISLSSSD
ncbi:MAG TPA: Bax inhibitor-1 family protein [Candidatus Binatia bacterium]|nr:Bax inhibitor-1 family protein [Candidatus Binatia bacterium]